MTNSSGTTSPGVVCSEIMRKLILKLYAKASQLRNRRGKFGRVILQTTADDSRKFDEEAGIRIMKVGKSERSH